MRREVAGRCNAGLQTVKYWPRGVRAASIEKVPVVKPRSPDRAIPAYSGHQARLRSPAGAPSSDAATVAIPPGPAICPSGAE